MIHEDEKIKVILMEPGIKAKVTYIHPCNVYKIVGRPNKRVFPYDNNIMFIHRVCTRDTVWRANRFVMDGNKEQGLMHGNILVVGYDNNSHTFRSLTESEITICMSDYEKPKFTDHVSYGLLPGTELVIKANSTIKETLFWRDKKPDKIVVVKEYKYFISCEGIWYQFDEDIKIRFSINKPLDPDYSFIIKRSGRVLE